MMINDAGLEIEEKNLKQFLKSAFASIEKSQKLILEYSETKDPSFFLEVENELTKIKSETELVALSELSDLIHLGGEVTSKASGLQEINKLITVQCLIAQLLTELERNLKALKKGDSFSKESMLALSLKLQKANQQL